MEKQQDLGKTPGQSESAEQVSNLFRIAYADAIKHGASVSDALEAAIAMRAWVGRLGKLDANPLQDQDTDPKS